MVMSVKRAPRVPGWSMFKRERHCSTERSSFPLPAFQLVRVRVRVSVRVRVRVRVGVRVKLGLGVGLW